MHWKKVAAAAAAKSLQSCLTLCNPIDGSPPGSPIPGILQARKLEWVAISFSNAWNWKVKVKSLSCVWLLVTPWTAAYQAPPSMGFSRQEYWSGLPFPYPIIFWKTLLTQGTKNLWGLIRKSSGRKQVFWVLNHGTIIVKHLWGIAVGRSQEENMYYKTFLIKNI